MKQSKGGVSTTMPDGTIKEEHYALELMEGPPKSGYQGPFVTVGFSMEVSVQLGDKYTLAKPRGWIELQVHPAKIDPAWSFAVEWVDEKLYGVRAALEAPFKDGGGKIG